jgi:hypothetical protein
MEDQDDELRRFLVPLATPALEAHHNIANPHPHISSVEPDVTYHWLSLKEGLGLYESRRASH